MGVLLLSCAGCNLPPGAPDGPSKGRDARQNLFRSADTAWTAPPAEQAPADAPEPARVTLDLYVFHIQIPSESADRMEKVWNYVREDVLPADVRLRLWSNGLRVGVGHERNWEPIRAVMEAIEGHRVTLAQPVRVPTGFPVALELDDGPHDQTLFHVGLDGVLSGSTWRQSRNVLRVTYAAEPEDPRRVRLWMVPEVRQRLKGWKYVRTESGLWQVPNQAARDFPAAGVRVVLGPGEFLLVAPGPAASLYGLLGGAFLRQTVEGVAYDSYVFVRPEVKRVGANPE